MKLAENELPLSEVFGPTWQGEGPHTGLRTGFVRLGLCNLSCEWCDTPYTWDETRYRVAEECPPTTVEEIHRQLRRMSVETVCLSGGEPLMHRGKLAQLLTPEWTWHAETNGTLAPPGWWPERVAHTTVSPKVITRDPRSKRIKPRVLKLWEALADRGQAAFKFVCSTPADLALVAEVVEEVGISDRHVWVMPEGTEPEDVLTRHRELADAIEGRGWNTTTRLHTLLYGQERGR